MISKANTILNSDKTYIDKRYPLLFAHESKCSVKIGSPKSGYRLLIIEDNPSIAALVSRIASDIGFDVRVTYNFANTPHLYDEFEPDSIVLDIIMPEVDGMEILNLLHHRSSASRIVILSGDAQYSAMASTLGVAFGLNIDAVVAKPFRIADLRDALKKIHDRLGADTKLSVGQLV